ncbi:TOMM precursor leader peptide-binding protein [Paenibacillus turpanensis]|uniref:TOMM precursor leader peptide-binding protein n=1 Tax=Paenibacillus turpanensis TaxID=2689078 RepID=UPI001FB84E0C|nr:TOMM precursor leader peptide-binding protein [Paenibacillus turpanensis]
MMELHNPTVVVYGSGRLAQFTAEALARSRLQIEQNEQLDQPSPAADFALVLADDWQPEMLVQAEHLLRAAGLPWIGAFAGLAEGVVGPLVLPDTPGCSQCAELRRKTAGRDSEELLQAQYQLLMHGQLLREQPLPDRILKQMALLLCQETELFLQKQQGFTQGKLYIMNLSTLECGLHAFLPDPTCSVCSVLPEDSQQLAQLTLPLSPKLNRDVYRSTSPEMLQAGLLDLYVDSKTGLLHSPKINPYTPFADVVLELASPLGDEAVGGRSHSYKASETTAVLEGLERLCGMAPRGKKTGVFDCYRNLKEHALDPLTTGVYSREQYASPDFPYEPFDPDREIPWVWGYSFRRSCPVLVPEQLAYYSGGEGFVHEFSNGCALGGSLTEAVFYGILEVVERDAFLMTWYGRLPLAELDPFTAGDTELKLMLIRIKAISGYEVRLFNAAMEHGVPSIWGIAKLTDGQGPNLICSAGAHVDPIRAARSVVYELASSIPVMQEKYSEHRESILSMLSDPYQVTQMEDHALLYCLPEAESRLQFLLHQEREPKAFHEAYQRTAPYETMKEELEALLHRLEAHGFEVIVVDQTSPETLKKGLHCVKVLIPGMLPMSFGYAFTRLTGLSRVLEIPEKLGFTNRPLTPEQLNPHPHPFL